MKSPTCATPAVSPPPTAPTTPALSAQAEAVLRTLRLVEVATTPQIVYHHWVGAEPPRTAGYGYRLLRELRTRGLVVREPLDREIGSISRDVLTLAAVGGVDRIAALRREGRLATMLQATEVRLQRLRDGWRWVPTAQVAALFRDAAVADWARAEAPLSDADLRRLVELRDAPLLPPGTGVLFRGEGATLEARLVFRVERTEQVAPALQALPDYVLLRRLDVEVVAADRAVVDEVHRRFAARYVAAGLPVTLHVVAPFTERPNPQLSTENIGMTSVSLAPSPAIEPPAPRPVISTTAPSAPPILVATARREKEGGTVIAAQMTLGF